MLILLPVFVMAQHTVSGTVTVIATGDALPGANVVVVGTNLGAATKSDGTFTVNNVPTGNYVIKVSFIGYAGVSKTENVSGDVTVNFSLKTSALELSALEVLASRAGEKTPVAFTNISKAEMEARLGSQDIPMILNTTPSVYATQQGGGAGDARINIRGFNQRNIAVMINGVPQNDMENGWVYWSNWDGVGDATSSIQMQRGLSAVNLATPSIGGTMNIITDPTALRRGGKFKQEIGAGKFLKTTVNYNTGLLNDKMAFSTTIVRKTADGIIQGNWTDSWSYYFGASYAVNDKNRLELYAIGAPQRHGQNLYKQNVGVYDPDFAKGLEGYDAAALDKFTAPESSHTKDRRLFSQNWAPIKSSYKGKQYWYMYGARTTERHDPNFLNERENFFHKPLVNLNHFLTINDKTRLSTVAYWSGGSGGGTGKIGSVTRRPAVPGNKWYKSSPWTWDWDATIANNSSNIDYAFSGTENRSKGVLRNSINRQWTIGAISKLNYDWNDALKLQFGLDWRTAAIEHAREVRDLLGGDYYVDKSDDNYPNGRMRKLGDIIAYHNETTVDWIGFFGQGNYTAGPISAYGMAGLSSIAYSYQDHFTVADKKIVADPISAFQVKGGVMYDVSDNMSVFGNFGIVEKPPIMDNVIYFDGTVATDPLNEKFVSTEFGLNYRTEKISTKVNYYNTQWKDRNLTKAVTTGQGSSGDTDVIFLTGVNQSHSGVEVEASTQVTYMLRFDVAASFGNWKFVDDAKGNYQEYTETGVKQTTYQYALKDLLVGDMPQTALIIGATLTPIPGLTVQGLFNWYDNNYADWSPAAREINSGIADREQVWKAPGYNKIDLHAYYNLPMSLAGAKLQVFAHIFNLTDEIYVQDATDNSQYNSWDKDHDADSAEVFLGIPRSFNMGLTVRF
ncbi:TonB-dependent receptor [Caldithrix abyssi]|nr:TonB-dependent receptor [Caldithrix abyssi]